MDPFVEMVVMSSVTADQTTGGTRNVCSTDQCPYVRWYSNLGVPLH